LPVVPPEAAAPADPVAPPEALAPPDPLVPAEADAPPEAVPLPPGPELVFPVEDPQASPAETSDTKRTFGDRIDRIFPEGGRPIGLMERVRQQVALDVERIRVVGVVLQHLPRFVLSLLEAR